jgi:acetolactate synthase-1/2/3 large subunit
MAKKTVKVETVAEAYFTLLHARGVEYLFANGGTDFAPVIEALSAIDAKGGKRLQVVSVPHENCAISMAHGYYLATGKPQAVMFHVNVGTMNGMNGLANAARDHVPIIFTAGRNPITEYGVLGSRDTGIHWAQEMYDQAGMVRELVKWDYELRRGDQLEEVVDRAIEMATMEPCGPVYLSLPREVMSAPLKEFSFSAKPRRANFARPGGDPAAIEQAAAILAKAERPILIGRGAGRTIDGSAAVAEFAERFAIPVVECRSQVISVDTTSPVLGGYNPLPHIKEADAILSVESDVPWIPVQHGQPADDCKVIQLGADPIYSNVPIRSFPCDVAVMGATGVALPQLADALARKLGKNDKKVAARMKRLKEVRAKTAKDAAGEAQRSATISPISPIWASWCIGQAKGDNDIVVNEYSLINRYAEFKKPRTFFGTPCAGGLGWGVGAAIGVKIANPDKVVIAPLGDGAYMFGNPSAGHQVLRNLGLGVLFVIFNNAMWEEVERAALAVFPKGQASRRNRVPVAPLGDYASYEHMMEVYGGYGERVDKPDELPKALQRALKAVKKNQQALLNVIVSRRGAPP